MEKTFSKRLQERAGELQLSQSEIARRVGVSQPSVNAWFKGETKNVRFSYAEKLAQVLNTTPEWLMYGEETRQERTASRREIPFGRFKSALGVAHFIAEEPLNIGLTSNNESYKATRVVGKQMQPDFNNGDIVVLDTEAQEIEDGSAYGLLINDRFTLAYVSISFSGETVLSSADGTQTLTLDIEPIIVGKVIFKATPL